MDYYVRASVSEFVCVSNWASCRWENKDNSSSIEVRVRITRTPSGTYVYDYGLTYGLFSREQKVCATTAERATRIQFDVYHGRRTIRIYA